MLSSFFLAVISFVVTLLVLPIFIRYYQLKKIGGQQMHEDVKQHLAKAGTPTMGGVVFLTTALALSLLGMVFLKTEQALLGLAVLVVILTYGLIGFLDDFLKIFRQINEGLKPAQKMALQLLAGLGFYALYVQAGGLFSINLFGYQLSLGIFYLFFVLFWLVGFSNAVNLTDGIDGLASISVVISLATYAVIAYRQGQSALLLIMLVMIGALLGFFVFNKKPAAIFMGDVGSLSLGAMLAAISIVLHQEWTLLFIGLVYVLETASVMLQVAYFKYTKKKHGKGRRIFRMTPFHHHLELGGLTKSNRPWNEWQVDGFLWGLGLLASLLTLLLM